MSTGFLIDFVFRLTAEEVENWRCQIGTSSSGYGGRRYRPFVFTEQEANRLRRFGYGGHAMVAKAPPSFFDCHPERSKESLTFSDRVNLREKAMLHLLRQMQDLLNLSAVPEPSKKKIGFHVRERRAAYRTKTK